MFSHTQTQKQQSFKPPIKQKIKDGLQEKLQGSKDSKEIGSLLKNNSTIKKTQKLSKVSRGLMENKSIKLSKADLTEKQKSKSESFQYVDEVLSVSDESIKEAPTIEKQKKLPKSKSLIMDVNQLKKNHKVIEEKAQKQIFESNDVQIEELTTKLHETIQINKELHSKLHQEEVAKTLAEKERIINDLQKSQILQKDNEAKQEQILKLQYEIQIKEQQITQQDEKIEKLSDINRRLNDHFRESKENMQQSRVQINNYKTDNGLLLQQLDFLKKQLLQFQQHETSLSSEIALLKIQLNQAKELKLQFEQTQIKLKELQDENATLKNKLSEIEQDHSQLLKVNVKQQQQQQESQEKQAQHEINISQLKMENAKLEEELKKKLADFESIKIALQKLQSESERDKDQIKQLQEQIQKSENYTNELSSGITLISKDVALKVQQIQQKDEQIAKLEQKCKEIEALKQQITQITKEKQIITQTLEQAQKQFEQSQKECECLRKEKQVLQLNFDKQLQQNENNNANEIGNPSEMQRENEELRNQLSSVYSHNQKQHQYISELLGQLELVRSRSGQGE